MVGGIVNRLNYFKTLANFNIMASFSDRTLDLGFECMDFAKNRRQFLDSLGIDYDNLVCAGQIHGANVTEIKVEDRGKVIADTDSLITKSKYVAIAVLTADCLSIFIYDKRCHAIGLVHAGWRGTKDKIVKKTIEMMQDRFGSQIEDLVCAFGPAIHPCCYEIGSDVGIYFSQDLIMRDKKIYLDLSAINQEQLFELGLTPRQIEDSDICTCCSINDFFSYRRQKDKAGRMMSVMMLK